MAVWPESGQYNGDIQASLHAPRVSELLPQYPPNETSCGISPEQTDGLLRNSSQRPHVLRKETHQSYRLQDGSVFGVTVCQQQTLHVPVITEVCMITWPCRGATVMPATAKPPVAALPCLGVVEACTTAVEHTAADSKPGITIEQHT